MPPSRQIDKVDLFLSTESNKFSYKGLCKVHIGLGPKLLVVKNGDADTPIIEIPFYYPFMMHQNILCHISPTKLHDIVLIFSTDKICNEVYNIVHNYQAKINHETVEYSNKVVLLSDRILNPLSLAISSDPNLSRSTKSRILQMVQPITSRENDKKVVIKSELSEHPTALPYSPAGPSTITINMPAAGSNISSPSIRKRKKQTQSSSSAVTVSPNKRCKTEVFDEDITPEATTITDTNNVFTKRFLNSTEYEIQTFYEKSIKKQKLIVYCTADKKLCYSYFYERKSKRFVCEKCKEQNRYVIAYLREQQYDSQFVELGLLPHLCNPIPYSPPPTTFYVHGNTDSNNQSLPGTSAINGLDLIPSSSLTSARNNTVTKTSATLRHLKKVNTKIVRKISEVFNNVTKEGNSGTPDSSSTLNQTPEILRPPQYQIHSFPSGSKHKQRLIVFYPYNQNYCFPYSYEVTNRRFICIRCKKNRRLVVAYVKYDSNGDEYLELGPLYHLCPPLPVENYPVPLNTNDEFNGSSNILPLEISVINSDSLTPDLDNNSFVAYDSVELKDINLLEESKDGDKDVSPKESDEVLKDVKQEEIDQNLKSELSEGITSSLADQEVFNASSPETAEFENDDDYSESEDAEESTAFEPKKILDSSQFEIQKFTKNGQQRLRLITFVSPNKKYGFFYYHDVNNKRFVCSKCRKQRHNVHAHLRENSNGESFVELGLRDHICKPVLYTTPVEKPKEIPLNPDQYVLTYSREGRLRPIIFASKDKKFCYEFSPNQRGIYICCGCTSKADAASINVVEEGNSFKISLRNAKHICKARKFLPEKNGEKILMNGRFKFYKGETNGTRELKLITFPYDDGNEKCYVYEYSKDDKFFHCINCQRDEEEGGEVIAKLFININGEEYIIDRIPKEHSCKPLIYSNLDQIAMNFLVSSGLNVKKLHSKTWNENKIVKSEGFELQRNRFGVLNALLLIFSSEDKRLCYRYYYDKFTKHYICNNCREKFKIKVTAKLYDDGEDGKQYLKLGSLEHQCSPTVYENERKIIKKPNYIIFDPTNVIVFPTSSRDECYRYSSKKLRCNPCRMKNKDVSVIILNDQNGEECLQLSKIEHVCELQKLEDVAEKIGVEVEDILAKAV